MTRGKQEKPAREDGDEVAPRATDGILGPNPFVAIRVEDLIEQFRTICERATQHPQLLLAQQAEFASELIDIVSGSSKIGPTPDDKRFRDADWNENKFYKMYLQGYLAWARRLDHLIGALGLSDKDAQRARFAVSLLTDAMAPPNMLWGNPAAMKKLFETGGASLLHGVQNMLRDLVDNQGMPAQVDKGSFVLGNNLATSPGAVVYRGPVLELVQYKPATNNVFARPLMIVPPQINKFYLFDLAPGRSLIEYLVSCGFQVFAVSWRNPTAEQRDWDMDTYVAALLEAIDAARAIGESDDVNLAGACSGAMTMSGLLGHLAQQGDDRVAAVTLMVVVLDRDDESQIGLFATPEAIAAAKQASKLNGVLRGQDMGRMFAWMRPNDLVWNYWVNNYLLGNPPPAYDILYWNNDTTRLPAGFHSQLLDVFLENLFRQRGALTVLGTPIDLARVKNDKFVVAGITDHITPWRAGYRASRLFGGSTEFVLSSSGHIQSIINPPGNIRASYYVNAGRPADADQWFKDAKRRSGSWWDHWRQWLSERSGPMTQAPSQFGNREYAPMIDAPGTYVLEH
jgi:polyhydroxyalkanoate synthase